MKDLSVPDLMITLCGEAGQGTLDLRPPEGEKTMPTNDMLNVVLKSLNPDKVTALVNAVKEMTDKEAISRSDLIAALCALLAQSACEAPDKERAADMMRAGIIFFTDYDWKRKQ